MGRQRAGGRAARSRPAPLAFLASSAGIGRGFAIAEPQQGIVDSLAGDAEALADFGEG
jgi:hypothetical protein